jgi:endonuclease/exonuclease/phosphatase family metal-dependent hydrolase
MQLISTIILLVFCSIFISSCKELPTDTENNKSYIEIGTFNIEHLRDKGKDIQQIAQVIKDTGVEIMGIQEIEDISAVKKLVKYLDGFKYKIGSRRTNMRIGVIYNSRVIDILERKEIRSLSLFDPERFRAGLQVYAKVKPDGFDFILLVVHLKSKVGGEKQTDKYRKRQIKCISRWLDKILKDNPYEKDIIIIGDFNEVLWRKPFRSLTKRKDIMILTKNIPRGIVSYIGKEGRRKYQALIDHIIIYKDVGEEYKSDSISILSNYKHKYPNYDACNYEMITYVSDHLPVYASFCIEDND